MSSCCFFLDPIQGMYVYKKYTKQQKINKYYANKNTYRNNNTNNKKKYILFKQTTNKNNDISCPNITSVTSVAKFTDLR